MNDERNGKRIVDTLSYIEDSDWLKDYLESKPSRNRLIQCICELDKQNHYYESILKNILDRVEDETEVVLKRKVIEITAEEENIISKAVWLDEYHEADLTKYQD